MSEHDARSQRLPPHNHGDSEAPESAFMLDQHTIENSSNRASVQDKQHDKLLSRAKPLVARRRRPWKVTMSMATFFILVIALAFICAHLGFCLWLDGQVVSSSGISQASQSAIANFFAIAVEVSIMGGMGLAYDQYLWRLLRRKSLEAGTIDTLITLAASPWDIWRPDVLRNAAFATMMAGLCALVPIAVVFPPGSLGVEFRDGVIPFTLHDVPTMNISDYGAGGYKEMSQRFFLATSDDMGWLVTNPDNLFNPRLVSIASGVLGSGGPLSFASPCQGTACTYDMSIRGPRFHCKELDSAAGMITRRECIGSDDTRKFGSTIYRAENRPQIEAKEWRVKGLKNTFKMSWWDDPMGDECDLELQKTLECKMTIATYGLHVDSGIQSRSINVTIDKDEEEWPEDSEALEFYYGAVENIPKPGSKEERDLSKKFGIAQAYGLSRIAISVLAGDILFDYPFEENVNLKTIIQLSFKGNATRILGSPYISPGAQALPKFNITPDSIQQFLQDFIISNIALNDPSDPLWVNQGAIQAYKGSNVYTFNEQMQFYAPYSAILVATIGIYLVGLWSLHKNGVSASSSFLQFAMTMSTSRSLHLAAQPCSVGGGENVSKELNGLRLRVGTHRGGLEGFGTENELENL